VFDDVPRANQRSLTQDLIANLLEVRGEGVTKNAGKLQDAGSVRYCVKRWARSLGPVHTISASANGWHRVPIEALDEVQTGRLHEECNEEWRPRRPVPFGLLPKWPCASLRSLAGRPARLRFAPRSWPFRRCNALGEIV